VLAGTDEIGLTPAPGVYVPGPLPDAAKWGALREASAVVIPSSQESLSLVALEAWACGRPVIANGESPVLTGQAHRSQAAVLYSGPESFAEIAATLLADPARRLQLGEAGQRFVQSTYAWGRVEDRYQELMRNLILEPGRSPDAPLRRASRQELAS
jgi:glycosyltransferase involved in cell wall biosynthesis